MKVLKYWAERKNKRKLERGNSVYRQRIRFLYKQDERAEVDTATFYPFCYLEEMRWRNSPLIERTWVYFFLRENLVYVNRNNKFSSF